jgi:hypothetical protein
MTNTEWVQKAMQDTYGPLEVSSEVSAKGVEFCDLMARELDRRDAIARDIAEGKFETSAIHFIGEMADDLARWQSAAAEFKLRPW